MLDFTTGLWYISEINLLVFRICLIYLLAFCIFRARSLNTNEIVITWLSYMPNQSTGISYIETLDFRILFTVCQKGVKNKNKNAWVWHPYFLKVYTPRHLKKVEKKYSVFKNSIFWLFNFFQYFIKSQNWHFLTQFLGAKKLLYVLYE